MIHRIALAILLSGVLSGAATAAGARLERDRLANLEGPDTVGLFRVRFDFQHNFKDYTLLPVVDLTLALGLWDTVQAEVEYLLHNSDTNVFGNRNQFQFNVSEYGLKWAILDQTRDDWCSLAVGAALGRSDIKYYVVPAPSTLLNPSLLRYHLNNRSAYAVAHYDTPWFSQYLGVRYAAFEDTRAGTGVVRKNTVTTPGFGERLKAFESKNLSIHLIGDFQPTSFKSRFSANAWGAGLQFMWGSPHIFTFFVSNTHGDTGSESVFGTRSFTPGPDFRRQEKFYNFRWSYRF